MELSQNPRSMAHEAGEIKRDFKKPDVCKSVSTTSRPLHMKKQPSVRVSVNPRNCPVVKKISTEMLELFEIAKKSADVANAKGLLASGAEASICVDTLSLLVSFPISATATETRRIMEKLERLTKHKDRKICNSASTLLHHWRQSIRDQQHKDARETQTKPDAVQVLSKRSHETKQIKQNLKKADACKSFAARPVQTKNQVALLPIIRSQNPKSAVHESKKQPPVNVSGNPRYCPALRKNSAEMLELFEIAKKSADVANAKGLLASGAEASICVDTLSLLVSFPISSMATETRGIMEKLERLTKHKDRKICNSASALLQHWRQSIRDQQG